jgi:hypothetical protein
MVLRQLRERTPPVAQKTRTGARPLQKREPCAAEVLQHERGGGTRLAEVIHVVRVLLDGQVVSKPFGLLVGVGVAADPRKQARVVHDAALGIIQGRALGKPQPDQARPDHVLHRLPEAQVGPK